MAKEKVSNGTQTVKCDLEHEILFHEQTLIFLQQNRNLRRPCTSLRVRGWGCLNQQDQVELYHPFRVSHWKEQSIERSA